MGLSLWLQFPKETPLSSRLAYKATVGYDSIGAHVGTAQLPFNGQNKSNAWCQSSTFLKLKACNLSEVGAQARPCYSFAN